MNLLQLLINFIKFLDRTSYSGDAKKYESEFNTNYTNWKDAYKPNEKTPAYRLTSDQWSDKKLNGESCIRY